MNIFFIDRDPILCAQAHYDKHVVKMILETAQLLSTAHWVFNGTGPYKMTHVNHPSAIWVREHVNHYTWAWKLMHSLGEEYTHRYGKVHKTIREHSDTLNRIPKPLRGLSDFYWRDPPQCMPEECRRDDTVDAYRYYYLTEKLNLRSYTKRQPPEWSKLDRIN